jgi:hypothetical protein
MRTNAKNIWWMLLALLTLPILVLTLIAQQSNSLVVNGQQGEAKVIQVQGHNYVEVEGLARITNGSVSFNGNHIVLTLPGSSGNASAPADAPAPAPVSAPGFSKEFMNAGIEAMAQVREWHSALRNAIERGFPLGDDWLAAYLGQSRQALRLASVAINTDSDKNAYPFLVNEFNNMKNLNDKYIQMAKNMNYIAPNSLQSDPLEQKFQKCAHTMASMATANQIIDDGSCQ